LGGAGQVHTVTYRLARPDEHVPDAAGASAGAAGGGGAESSGGGGGGAGQECVGEQDGSMAEQLQRRIGARLGLDDPAASGEMRLTLRLLRALSILAHDWFQVAPPTPTPSAPDSVPLARQDRRPLVARADFVNAKLASKLVRQLQARPTHAPRTCHARPPHGSLPQWQGCTLWSRRQRSTPCTMSTATLTCYSVYNMIRLFFCAMHKCCAMSVAIEWHRHAEVNDATRSEYGAGWGCIE
jgi:hypothetical protein